MTKQNIDSIFEYRSSDLVFDVSDDTTMIVIKIQKTDPCEFLQCLTPTGKLFWYSMGEVISYIRKING